MDRILIDTPEAPEINISSIKGTLRLKGWDRPQIRVDMEIEDTLSIETVDDIVTISCKSGCLLRIPNDSTLNIEKVLDDLVIKSLDGCINVNRVNGQILVKSIGSITVEKVLGNMNAKHVEGDLECGEISGNANIQDVDGQINLEKVVGNLAMQGYSASLSAKVSGNANLRLEPEPDGQYLVSAKGNISCRMEPFSNATISMLSKTEKIRINLPGMKETLSAKKHEVILREGESEVNLEAGGSIDLSSRSEYSPEDDFVYNGLTDIANLRDDISQMVTGQIESQMDSISKHLNDLTSNLPGMDAPVADTTRRRLEAKRRNLERKLAAAERKAEFKSRQAERKRDRRYRTEWGARKPASDPVSDEERQKVLEMLQNRQISVAEAEVLLAALEGRAPATPGKVDSSKQGVDDQDE